MSHPACFNCEKNQEECLNCEFFDYREDDFDEVDDDPVYSLGDFDDYEDEDEDEDEEVYTWGEE